MPFSHDVYDLSSCKIDKAAQCHVSDEPMPPLPQIISLQQIYTHDVLDVVSSQRFLREYLRAVLYVLYVRLD